MTSVPTTMATTVTTNDDGPESDKDAFDQMTEQANDPNGLYQACMKSIRQAHLQANRLRASLVLAGLFTDKLVYRDVVTIFYVVTKEMEMKLHHLANNQNDEICHRILSLGYNFTPRYEQDMEVLWGSNWKEDIDTYCKTVPIVGVYTEHIQIMSCGNELAGAAFVLWGALIIGGGAAAYPRVKHLVGSEATNLFQPIIGPKREQRKQQFIQTWESLASQSKDKDEFNEIVASCLTCMQYNNDIFTSMQRTPWWAKYVTTSIVTALAAIVIGTYV